MKHDFDKLTEAQKNLLAMSSIAPWSLDHESRLRWIESTIEPPSDHDPSSIAWIVHTATLERYEEILDEFDADPEAYFSVYSPPSSMNILNEIMEVRLKRWLAWKCQWKKCEK